MSDTTPNPDDRVPPPAQPPGQRPVPPPVPPAGPTGPVPPRPGFPPAGHAYDPGDNTGAGPFPSGSPRQIGTSFFRSLFDFTFTTFITRKLAGVFYVLGLVVVALAAIVFFISSLVTAFAAFRYNGGAGLVALLTAIIGVPVVTFLSVVILRFWIEAVVALIAVAENTERTAENTRRR